MYRGNMQLKEAIILTLKAPGSALCNISNQHTFVEVEIRVTGKKMNGNTYLIFSVMSWLLNNFCLPLKCSLSLLGRLNDCPCTVLPCPMFSLFWSMYCNVEKRDNRPKMESLVLGPTSANQDLILNLIAVSAFQNVTFNLSTWNYLLGQL